jgi:SWI/SNF-related matrix-associated actin-dependent regulator 1 of chromatin subfamily A
MKATRHNEATLHRARYRIEFGNPEAARAAARAVRMQADGDGFIVSAMDMYKIAEAAGACGDRVPSDVLDEVRVMRVSAREHMLVREPEGMHMYPFQDVGSAVLTMSRDFLLADEMGLGKTIQALMALPEQAFGIVVAPRSLLLGWCREAALWRPDLKFESVDREHLRGVIPGEFLVATPDAVRLHHKNVGLNYASANPQPGSVIILDEAHLYKNPDAARTESIQRLSTHFDIRWALTGTPLANKPVDLWGTLSSVGLAMRMFGDRQNFDRIFGGVKDEHGAYYWAKQVVDPDGLRDAFRGRSLRRLRRVVAPEIPEKTYSTIHHEHPPVCTDEDRAKSGRFEEGSLNDKFDEVVASVQRKLAESKIPVMFSTVDRFVESGDALVVFSANVGPLEALAEKYGCGLIIGATSIEDRAKIVDNFQSGQTKLIGLQIQAGGVGITLTAAHHLLFVQRDFSPANSDQAEDRICRLGQKSTCVIYDILSDHPLDQIIKRVLASKARLMLATTSAIPAEV